MKEWRDIPSLPEYQVSSDGTLMCKPIESAMPYGGVRVYGGKEWAGCWAEKEKRYIFRFRGKTYKVAPLVCEAFHGPRPLGAVCMHLDENARNNRPENLAWGTQKENLNAPNFKEHCRTAKRARGGAVLPEESIRQLKRRALNGESRASLAREFGVSASHVSNVAAGRARPNVRL